MVGMYKIRVYVIECDCCKCVRAVEEDFSKRIYNGAQAVRSIGWSYGRNKQVLCSKCKIDRCKRHIK